MVHGSHGMRVILCATRASVIATAGRPFGMGVGDEEIDSTGGKLGTHTTICLRPSRGLRMNLRVRSVTGESESAILAV